MGRRLRVGEDLFARGGRGIFPNYELTQPGFSLLFSLNACGPERGDTATDATTDSTNSTTDAPGTTTDLTEGPTTPTTTAETTSGGSDTADPTTTGEFDPRCECPESTCVEQLCENFGVSCDDDECAPGHPVDNEDAVQCALEALRDRTPGTIRWYSRVLLHDTGNDSGHDTTVRIRPDGSVIVHVISRADRCTIYDPVTANSLPEPAYFEGCLGLATAPERFECLTAAQLDELVECAPMDMVCDGRAR
ncbi:hypothetical protein [Nannocystis radixulma]|uniref:Uncharacterized protein n=1 Tax=Nannocystis radixulma TaxID=2995305 RepID=A0ABT5B3F4_9BACT|nr:hypothetical protein [Nannocystis radixulma]MDC0668626.1 hypothetical protein [Nannocystis radixulma]